MYDGTIEFSDDLADGWGCDIDDDGCCGGSRQVMERLAIQFDKYRYEEELGYASFDDEAEWDFEEDCEEGW